MSHPILKVNHLSKHFRIGYHQRLVAVDDISFSLKKGDTLGIVGESGCGKTTLGRTIMHIFEPTEGTIEIDGQLVEAKNSKLRQEMAHKIQMVFQDPYASLNPRMTVGDIIGEGWNYRRQYEKAERRRRVVELLHTVGLNEEHASRFPHEFSGGQRQRIGIARALSMEPEILICDEPISALDVSIQAQVMNLLLDLQREKNLSYLFIAHDLSMVRYISTNIMVMYLGSEVEFGPSDQIYHNGVHPYTEALFSAIVLPDPDCDRLSRRIMLEGETPSPINAPSGCKFSTRCAYAQPICHEKKPELTQVADNHYCACFFPRLERLELNGQSH